MPWQFEHILGQAQRVADSADIKQVPAQPLVVVCKVVNLVGEHTIPHHVCMVDPGGGLLLKTGVLIPLQFRIDVSRHVPHVGDPRSRLSAPRSGIQCVFGLLVIPKVDTKMMAGVHRVFRQNLLEQGVDGQVTVQRQATATVAPQLKAQEGLGFDVLGELVRYSLQRLGVCPATVLVLLGPGLDVCIDGLDVHPLAFSHLALESHGLGNKSLGSFVVVDVGHRHAPVGSGTGRINRRRLAKRPLSFKEPETVQLPHSLVDELLHNRLRTGGRKRDVSGIPHQVGFLPRSFVEGFPVIGVSSRQRLFGFRFRLVFPSLCRLGGILGQQHRTFRNQNSQAPRPQQQDAGNKSREHSGSDSKLHGFHPNSWK